MAETSLSVYLYFNGNCREALDFYSGVFKQKPTARMTYGEAPDGAGSADKDRILYSCIPICGCNVMLSDCPSTMTMKAGDNIALTIGIPEESELRRIFGCLAQGGTVDMELDKTFFAPLFGMVTDKFGIPWQISKV
ncbi:MAG: VOC family protein [Spirochaetaceae bacterium]|jgi:PhnB protein|nr:VOC family protein [Spirochaetaceae bacterium]